MSGWDRGKWVVRQTLGTLVMNINNTGGVKGVYLKFKYKKM